MPTNDTFWLLRRPAQTLASSLDGLELLCSTDSSHHYGNGAACDDHSEATIAVADTSHLGAGSFGSVYLGRVTLKKAECPLYKGTITKSDSCRFSPKEAVGKKSSLVAVKRLKEADIEAVIRESCSLALMADSCNVVKVFGPARVAALQGACCIVMDYVDGKSLNHFLKTRGHGYLRSGCLTSSSSDPNGGFGESCGNTSIFRDSKSLWWKVKIEIFRELVIGLLGCHIHKVFHGDLKGENVLIDRCLIPKIIDFGMSFGKEDLSYYRDAGQGGSLFWVSPEMITTEAVEEVKEDPYPSDVYSLGMILVEMSINGEIPEFSQSFVNYDKYMDSPIPIQENNDLQELKEFYRMLQGIVDKCCFATREERCSLLDCLSDVEEAYTEICNVCEKIPNACAHKFLWDPFCHDDFSFTHSEKYQSMLKTDIRRMLPHVPDCVLLQPSKNMVVDMEGRLLIHYFCIADYVDGVEHILKHDMRQFNDDMDLPYMAQICVRAGSISVMRMLAKRWKAVLAQKHILVHEVCESCVVNKQTNYVDMLRLLLFELGLEYDTWYDSFRSVEYDLKKPIHKLATASKTDMIQVILDRACMDGNVGYIDTSISASKGRETALTYAVGADNLEAALFLISQGAGRYSGSKLFDELFGVALKKGSARVATWLLRNAPRRGSEDVIESQGKLEDKSADRPDDEGEDEDGTEDEDESGDGAKNENESEDEDETEDESNLEDEGEDGDGTEDDDESGDGSKDEDEDEDETVDESTGWLAEFQNDPDLEQNLAVLETHMKFTQLDGHIKSHPVLLACSKEQQQAFECLHWLGVLRHTEEVVPLVCERGTSAMLELLLNEGLDLEAHGAKLLTRAIQFQNDEVSEFIVNYLAKFSTSTLEACLPSVLCATSERHRIKKPSNIGQQEEAAFDQDYEHDQLCKAIVDNDAGTLALEIRALRKNSVDKRIMEKLGLCCCENKNVELLRLLEAEGLDIKEASDRLGFLQRAISSNAMENVPDELVKYLLERGAFVDSRDLVSDATPLMCAAEGDDSLMKILLSAGANVELRDISGCTAMDRALMLQENFRCVKTLICHGFNLHMLDKDGVDYLTRVTQEVRDKKYCTILKEALIIEQISLSTGTGTARTNVMREHLLQLDNSMLKNLASFFCERGDVKMLRMLEEDGNLDVQEASVEKRLLHLSAAYGRVDMIRYLLERGIAVDCSFPGMQDTPLLTAAGSWLVDCIAEETMAVLLEAGADPNFFDAYGTTALDRALGMRHRRCVKLLIRSGFNMGLTDRDGNTFMMDLLSSRKGSLRANDNLRRDSGDEEDSFFTLNYL